MITITLTKEEFELVLEAISKANVASNDIDEQIVFTNLYNTIRIQGKDQ
jgi:nitrogen regulatory protein PII